MLLYFVLYSIIDYLIVVEFLQDPEKPREVVTIVQLCHQNLE